MPRHPERVAHRHLAAEDDVGLTGVVVGIEGNLATVASSSSRVMRTIQAS
jgi:hypothetical protein